MEAGIKAYNSRFTLRSTSPSPNVMQHISQQKSSPEVSSSSFTTSPPPRPLPKPYLPLQHMPHSRLPRQPHPRQLIHASAYHQMASPFRNSSLAALPVSSLFLNIKPDPQPCRSQTLQPRPLYLDALPSPISGKGLLRWEVLSRRFLVRMSSGVILRVEV